MRNIYKVCVINLKVLGQFKGLVGHLQDPTLQLHGECYIYKVSSRPLQDCMYKAGFSLQRLVITYKAFCNYLLQGLSHHIKGLCYQEQVLVFNCVVQVVSYKIVAVSYKVSVFKFKV
jgi:hypothetical protein